MLLCADVKLLKAVNPFKFGDFGFFLFLCKFDYIKSFVTIFQPGDSTNFLLLGELL